MIDKSYPWPHMLVFTNQHSAMAPGRRGGRGGKASPATGLAPSTRGRSSKATEAEIDEAIGPDEGGDGCDGSDSEAEDTNEQDDDVLTLDPKTPSASKKRTKEQRANSSSNKKQRRESDDLLALRQAEDDGNELTQQEQEVLDAFKALPGPRSKSAVAQQIWLSSGIQVSPTATIGSNCQWISALACAPSCLTAVLLGYQVTAHALLQSWPAQHASAPWLAPCLVLTHTLLLLSHFITVSFTGESLGSSQ